mmetsp:Transcript_120951/g.209040  ORF Transcript_120951/g.209040 Transcript_120951/m.209040 type:complete len:119 (-) Transcript_120951:783-1139(-)
MAREREKAKAEAEVEEKAKAEAVVVARAQVRATAGARVRAEAQAREARAPVEGAKKQRAMTFPSNREYHVQKTTPMRRSWRKFKDHCCKCDASWNVMWQRSANGSGRASSPTVNWMTA